MFSYETFLPASASRVMLALVLTAGLTWGILCYLILLRQKSRLERFPIVSLDGKSAKESWFSDGRKVVAKGLEQYPGLFRVITGTGSKIIIPSRYHEELRSHPNLRLNKGLQKEFFVDYPGFEAHRQALLDEKLIQGIVRYKLNPALGDIIPDLVDESFLAISETFGEPENWKPVYFKKDILNVVARLTSRILLGEKLCRNERWLEIAKTYTSHVRLAAFELRKYNPILRPFVHWFLPRSKIIRKAVQDAHDIIDPEVKRRRITAQKTLEKGSKSRKSTDALEWIDEVGHQSGRKVDHAAAQLFLTVAAIHTTNELLSQAMVHICETPGLADQLREEVVRVFRIHGWSKTTFYQLKFMDSMLKESQRHRSMFNTTMPRMVVKDTRLADGTVLPKDAVVLITDRHIDPVVFPDPEKFIPGRFMGLRSAEGQENNYQVVTPDVNHLLWGYGKYDWRFPPDEPIAEPVRYEQDVGVNANIKMELRKRKEEMELRL